MLGGCREIEGFYAKLWNCGKMRGFVVFLLTGYRSKKNSPLELKVDLPTAAQIWKRYVL